MKRALVAFLALSLTTLSGAFATADDEQIAKKIVDRLQQHRQSAQLQDFNIGVQVEDGTVTMMGNVAASDHAVLALDIARRIPGVKLVINDLYVQAQPTGAANPAEVAAEEPAAPKPPQVVEAPTPTQPVEAPEPPKAAEVPLKIEPPAPAPAATVNLEAPAPTSVQQAAMQQPAAIPAPPAAAIPAMQPTQQRFQQPVAQPMVISPSRPLQSGTAAGFIPQQRAPAYGPVGNGAVAQPPQRASQAPLAFARSYGNHARPVSYAAPEYSQSQPGQYGSMGGPAPVPMGSTPGSVGTASYDNPQMPGYAWPSYAAYPNYAAVTYPHQYSATAWPYIGPFYPYPQVPLGWRKVMLEWDDGWWFLDFKSK
ncbi:MAG: BON domain-containing protein [Planctomycetaceae bacterium]|nr:BON domain-containing protein [Planctomycetaceae bacterium]